MIPPIAP